MGKKDLKFQISNISFDKIHMIMERYDYEELYVLYGKDDSRGVTEIRSLSLNSEMEKINDMISNGMKLYMVYIHQWDYSAANFDIGPHRSISIKRPILQLILGRDEDDVYTKCNGSEYDAFAVLGEVTISEQVKEDD